MPAGLQQLEHWHPTARFGLVLSGNGRFKIRDEFVEFGPGSVLILDPGDVHSFHTENSGAVFVAFHPDSTIGPTHQIQNMLDRTVSDTISGSRLLDAV
nr:AraC family ligand binding domain-containing protein [Caulobacter sp. SLTY]